MGADWDDAWEIALIVAAVLGILAILILLYKKCQVKPKKPVQCISTIQESYVPAPQFNPNFQNNQPVGWYVTNLDANNQSVGVNIRGPNNDVHVLPREPAAFYGYPYEKPPPYNPDP
ncbi:hypothetical protein RN001_000302 [Aquatica leii]|uniref:Uncharacterized protein n=1 Tax=Aquatica leii TaxID=1421715 RepID=A0AAN7PM40_9COLE|nr:hypothetical protein RN001_000302 [Aquatica leii]